MILGAQFVRIYEGDIFVQSAICECGLKGYLKVIKMYQPPRIKKVFIL